VCSDPRGPPQFLLTNPASARPIPPSPPRRWASPSSALPGRHGRRRPRMRAHHGGSRESDGQGNERSIGPHGFLRAAPNIGASDTGVHRGVARNGGRRSQRGHHHHRLPTPGAGCPGFLPHRDFSFLFWRTRSRDGASRSRERETGARPGLAKLLSISRP